MGEHKSNILLIEDNEADAELLQRAVQIAGLDCEFTVIEDGEDALKYVRQSSVAPGHHALAILDLNIPKHDGLEVLEAMRASRGFANLPVIVLTSSASPRERSRLESLKIVAHLVKPPDFQEFMNLGKRIKDILQQSVSGSTE